MRSTFIAALSLVVASSTAQGPPDLRPGFSLHAFDHLGGIAHQAEAAAAIGATVLYASGIGGDGYSGLPAPEEFEKRKRSEADYAARAKALGIPTVLGYVCATSIVGLDIFDVHWTPDLRARFGSRPADWLQQARNGEPLPSWYGGEYRPACMNNPGWRAYERYMVQQQLESGHDGIFFDNPTVHPKGCYCAYCMTRFETFLLDRGIPVKDHSIAGLRAEADRRGAEFAEFRCTIARDFLAEMRVFARTINPNALITANNSLNSASVLYAQCRSYAYNIFEMSKAEDFVVVEDMSSQPRVDAKGAVIEYGPTYRQLDGVVHGRPLVAVTIAEADYHTPPNLVRLAMSEAAAHGATYLAWPTWPEDQRARMIDAVRPQTDWLRENAGWLNETRPRADALLFLPFRRWQETEKCPASQIAARLSAANVQYRVVCEDALGTATLAGVPQLVLEDRSVLNEDESSAVGYYEAHKGAVVVAVGDRWLDEVRAKSTARLEGPPELRAVVRDGADVTLIFLYNLNITRRSSFEDDVRPARGARIVIDVPFRAVDEVQYSTAGLSLDSKLDFSAEPAEQSSRVTVSLPEISIAGIVRIRPKK